MSRWSLPRALLDRPRALLLRLSCQGRRLSGTAWLGTPNTEHIQVPCASAGHVTISLHDLARHPVSSPLIINLPAFPVRDPADVDSYLPRFLHRYPSATIHYRWPCERQPISGHDDDSVPDSDSSSHSPSPPVPAPSSPFSSSPPLPPPGVARAAADQDIGTWFLPDSGPSDPPLHWPTPIHDVLAAYDHLVHTLAPPPSDASGQPRRHRRRDVYVYGSYLGAGLAASLGLTETHTHEPVAVRGFVALNGVYNWTTFLPDHYINTLRASLSSEHGMPLPDPGMPYALKGGGAAAAAGVEDIGLMKLLMPSLFRQPADLFDPLASPVLFFHTPGMMVPPGFTERWTVRAALGHGSGGSGDDDDDVPYIYSDPEDPPPPAPFPDLETDGDSDSSSTDGSGSGNEPAPAAKAPHPRKGHFKFPPQDSTLRIPESLLLHGTPPPLPPLPGAVVDRRGLRKRLRNAENSFGSQAEALARLMRRSVEKMELRERIRWDDELIDCEGEVLRRVGTGDVGPVTVGKVGEETEEMIALWLEERLG